MPRVFACLAVSNLLLVIVTAGLGLFPTRLGADRHVLLAVVTLLFSCFVQAVVFTYLTVTGKMMGQAVHLARLDAAILVSVKTYKRTLTRNLALVFVAVLLVTATGAAGWRIGSATTLHLVAAGFAVIAHGWAFVRQFEIVYRNSQLVDRTLQEYEATRNAAPPARPP